MLLDMAFDLLEGFLLLLLVPKLVEEILLLNDLSQLLWCDPHELLVISAAGIRLDHHKRLNIVDVQNLSEF